MIAIAYYHSPIGCIEIKGSELGIQSVGLIEEKKSETKEPAPFLKDCVQQLKEYFARERKTFDLKFDWSNATDFNKSVWKELLKIPYGRTTSYSAIAKKIENPKAVQAVGLANKHNPIPFIVPCHRVIAKNGNLHGYSSGLDIKRKLLELENPISFAQQGKLF